MDATIITLPRDTFAMTIHRRLKHRNLLSLYDSFEKKNTSKTSLFCILVLIGNQTLLNIIINIYFIYNTTFLAFVIYI